MKSLVEINQQGLDNWGSNSRHFSDKGVPGVHNYIPFYDEKFSPYRSHANVLEIGTSCGGSLWMYAQYFQSYKIIGIDMLAGWPDGPLPYSASLENDPNISLFWNTDCHSVEFWNSIENNSLDIIIDDGDHSVQGQLDTFDLVWPKLNTNGVYCIEDVTKGGHKDFVIDSLKNKNLNIVIDTYYGNSRNDDIIIWITHAR